MPFCINKCCSIMLGLGTGTPSHTTAGLDFCSASVSALSYARGSAASYTFAGPGPCSMKPLACILSCCTATCHTWLHSFNGDCSTGHLACACIALVCMSMCLLVGLQHMSTRYSSCSVPGTCNTCELASSNMPWVCLNTYHI